jgi:hypothetical protein
MANKPPMQTTVIGAHTSAKTGEVYSYALERQTRTDYAEFGNPASKYEREYFQVNVYAAEGARVSFAFVNDLNDSAAILKAVEDVIAWAETDPAVLASIGSRFD